MRKIIVVSVGAAGVMLAACLSAPAEPTVTSTSALTCKSSERAFNGACRATCTTSAQCAAPNTCMTVAAGVSLCVDYSACAYLESDTECGTFPYGGSYESYPSFDPYAGPIPPPPGVDLSGGYLAPDPYGCGGNAVWHTQPPAPSSDPRCGQPHTVNRCTRVGGTCALVSSTTIDIAER